MIKHVIIYYNENNSYIGNVDEDKVLLVRAGGTLEVHGSKKLPCTKLENTAPKLENSPGFKAVVKVCEPDYKEM